VLRVSPDPCVRSIDESGVVVDDRVEVGVAERIAQAPDVLGERRSPDLASI
jgi:hypothetical protein